MNIPTQISLKSLNKINSKTISDNILKRMMTLNINEAELARLAHLPQPTVHKILARKTIDPRYSTLKALAHFFDITIDELATGIKPVNSLKSMQPIPIISWQDCTNNLKFLDKLTQNNWPQWIIFEKIAKRAFALTSKPSMESHFNRGTKLIINPEADPQDGDLLIVKYQKTQEATLRELSIDGPNQLLLPNNPNLKPDILNSDIIQIIGVVIQSRFDY